MWRPEAVGNVGNVGIPWPPGITGLKISYGSPFPGMPYYGTESGLPDAQLGPFFSAVYWGYPIYAFFGLPFGTFGAGFPFGGWG